jgi:hypothetical protein
MAGTATLCWPGAPYAHQVPEPVRAASVALRPSARCRPARFPSARCASAPRGSACFPSVRRGAAIFATTTNIGRVGPLSPGGLLSG